MIFRKCDENQYHVGINWDYQRNPSHGGRWWFILVLNCGLFRIGFRFRTKIKPYFINYSHWSLINEFPDFDKR